MTEIESFTCEICDTDFEISKLRTLNPKLKYPVKHSENMKVCIDKTCYSEWERKRKNEIWAYRKASEIPEGTFNCDMCKVDKLYTEKYTFNITAQDTYDTKHNTSMIICKNCHKTWVHNRKIEIKKIKYTEDINGARTKDLERAKIYNQRPEVKEANRTREQERYKRRIQNSSYKIRQNIKSQLHKHLKQKTNTAFYYTSCDSEHIQKWIKFNFTTEMSFEDKDWDIDHVIPCYYFDMDNSDEALSCWHWSNLVPLDSKTNSSKGNKILIEQIENVLHKHKEFGSNFNNPKHIYNTIKNKFPEVFSKLNFKV